MTASHSRTKQSWITSRVTANQNDGPREFFAFDNAVIATWPEWHVEAKLPPLLLPLFLLRPSRLDGGCNTSPSLWRKVTGLLFGQDCSGRWTPRLAFYLFSRENCLGLFETCDFGVQFGENGFRFQSRIIAQHIAVQWN